MNIHRRIARLEKAVSPTDTERHITLAPEKRRERIGELISKMAPEEITSFEEKHGFSEGHIKNLIA